MTTLLTVFSILKNKYVQYGLILLIFFYLFVSWQKSINDYNTCKLENESLKSALEHPQTDNKTIVKYIKLPTKTVTIYKDRVITSTQPSENMITEIENAPLNGNSNTNGVTISEVTDGGYIVDYSHSDTSTPVIPDNKNIHSKIERFSLMGRYAIKDGTIGAGLTYRVFQLFPIELGAGFDGKNGIEGIVQYKF